MAFKARVLVPGAAVAAAMTLLVACPPPQPPPPPESTTTTSTPQPPTGPPNVIFFLSDDQTSDQMMALPAVQQLIAGRGVNFTTAIAPIPLCCPARASLLTGQYPHNHHVLSNKASSGGGFSGLDQTNTIARWLHDAGYRTGHVGKYMNGYTRSKTIPLGWDEWWATSQNPFLMYDYTLNHNGAEVPFGFAAADYKTDVITRFATDFVRTSASGPQPFYLQVWYTAPHVEEGTDSTGHTFSGDPPRPANRHLGLYGNAPFPPNPSNFNEADVSDKPAWVRALPTLGTNRTASMAAKYRTQLASLASVDEGVRQVIDAVFSAGELNNTVLIFASDNGNEHGEHRIPFGKGDVYEPAIKVPLAVAGPGFPTGGVVGAPVMFPDVPVSIASLAGATPGRTMDGRRLEDAIASPNGDRAILIGSGLDTSADSQFSGVRTRRWVYATYPAKGETELYDLVNDPNQLQSRHADPAYAQIKNQLESLRVQLSSCAGGNCNVSVPPDLT